MNWPSSELFSVQAIPDTGRGVVAAKTVSKGTLIIRSHPPAAHVVFWQYRKEVCAQCFHYDRGRNLPVRHPSTGKVFCAVECREEWLEEQSELGVEAWEGLCRFVQSRSSKVKGRDSRNDHGQVDISGKPGEAIVKASWQDTNEIAEILRDGRLSVPGLILGVRAEKKYRKASNHARTQVVDPDILAFFLSGILMRFNSLNQRQDVLGLAMDEEPYRSMPELKAHCNSFIQLTAIAPIQLLPLMASVICQTLVSAASHNAFGIRSGSEDKEEYMGYALYPWASFFNHSCDPNIRKTHVGRLWEFHVLRNVGTGEQCCITYLGGDEKDLNVHERRTRLKETWGFECLCERCVREIDA